MKKVDNSMDLLKAMKKCKNGKIFILDERKPISQEQVEAYERILLEMGDPKDIKPLFENKRVGDPLFNVLLNFSIEQEIELNNLKIFNNPNEVFIFNKTGKGRIGMSAMGMMMAEAFHKVLTKKEGAKEPKQERRSPTKRYKW